MYLPVPQPYFKGSNLSCLVANKPRGKINKQKKTTKGKKRQYTVKCKKGQKKKETLRTIKEEMKKRQNTHTIQAGGKVKRLNKNRFKVRIEES